MKETRGLKAPREAPNEAARLCPWGRSAGISCVHPINQVFTNKPCMVCSSSEEEMNPSSLRVSPTVTNTPSQNEAPSGTPRCKADRDEGHQTFKTGTGFVTGDNPRHSQRTSQGSEESCEPSRGWIRTAGCLPSPAPLPIWEASGRLARTPRDVPGPVPVSLTGKALCTSGC